MTFETRKQRFAAIEKEIADLRKRIEELDQMVADRAPASEIERLNYAFDLISDRAPASEIERLNYAFDLISDRRQSERVVEVPWVLGKYQGERRVLEVGYAFAEQHYLAALNDLEIPFLVGIDAARSPWPSEKLRLHQIQADVLKSCIKNESFDLILCVSTIEHMGRDNTRYGLEASREEVNPDHIAIRAMADWLAPGGRLLVTVPFGRFEDVGWLINYDIEHLEALIKSSGLDAEELTFFGWMPGGWREVEPGIIEGRGYKSLGASDGAGVALIELRKVKTPRNSA